MLENFIGPTELEFILYLAVALLCGLIIGIERETRGKPAGLSTQTLVVSASMIFTFLSQALDFGDPTRIAAQVVTGIGFLGAGIILRSEGARGVNNVTTAASVWYAAAVGMAIGFDMLFIAIIAALYAALVSRIPHMYRLKRRFESKDE
jgi:putative Mg2+ transporter-C (MgtC) family protein